MAVELVPLPARGRVFHGARRVRLGDAALDGRLRLDALARYLQDVSNDDTRDAGFSDEWGWVVRRTVVEVVAFPVLGEELDLATFCGATGGRWAERRVSVRGTAGGHVEAATLWVHVDPTSARPVPLPARFHEVYGEAAAGRTVSARLLHDDVPAERGTATLSSRPWTVRAVDLDVLGHVNNAAYWAVVEELLADRPPLRDAPVRAEVEFRVPVEPGSVVEVVADDRSPADLAAWLVGEGGVHASTVVRRLGPTVSPGRTDDQTGASPR
jgi:acyl-ACP thioesterase